MVGIIVSCQQQPINEEATKNKSHSQTFVEDDIVKSNAISTEAIETPPPLLIDIIWNDTTPLTKHHPEIQDFWAENMGSLDVTVVDSMVTLMAHHQCGDECGANKKLILQDNGAGELPNFVSFTHSKSDEYDGANVYSFHDGILVIQEWDINGVISGYIQNRQEARSRLYFWHNFTGQDLFSRHINHETITNDELIIALQTDNLTIKRDALYIIRQTRPNALVNPLIDALTDLTPIPPDDSKNIQWRYLSNEVAFTLSAVAQEHGGPYFAFREPKTDYMAHDIDDLQSNPPPPTPERIADIQTNWRAEFDHYHLNE